MSSDERKATNKITQTLELKGIFISFEGGEGVGKSTQLRLLSDFLTQQDIRHCVTREPGGTPSAEILRNLIVSETSPHWDPLTETLLIHAARREHLQRVVFPALEQGIWVLCDRFWDSSFVYQGLYPEVGHHVIQQLSSMIMGNFCPDLTFFLDLDASTGLNRKVIARQEQNRFEAKEPAYHNQIRQAFQERARLMSSRNVIISADLAVEEIAKNIQEEIQKRFLKTPTESRPYKVKSLIKDT